MRVAFVTGYPNGGVDQVGQGVKLAVAPLGIDVDIFHAHDHPQFSSLDDYDLVHLGYYRYAAYIDNKTTRPITSNMWHISISGDADATWKWLARFDVRHIVVDDVMTLQQLGEQGFYNVTKIPLPVIQERWHHLPPPPGEFSVGIFCNDYPYKRWETVVAGAKLAGVKCKAYVTASDRSAYDLDPMKDVYANVHCLASATFIDTNSLPLREALCCGRPVISCQNDGMGRVLRPGENGYWFDGSPRDLAKKLILTRDNYDKLVVGAKATQMEPLADIGAAYKEMWEAVLEDYD